MTPVEHLAARVRRDGATPFLTWYDDASGERLELSAVSLANAVAKTANLLAGDLGVESGEVVAVRMPAHWQTASVLLGLWSLGAVADLGAAHDTRVQVVAEARLAEHGVDAAEDVLAFSLAPPLGPTRGRLRAPLRPGLLDAAIEVLSQPDDFWDAPPDPAATALLLGGPDRAPVEVSGAVLGEPAGLPPEARVVARADWTTLAGLQAGLLAPLAAGGSVVLIADPAADRLADRAAQEHATTTWGLGVAGLPVVPLHDPWTS